MESRKRKALSYLRTELARLSRGNSNTASTTNVNISASNVSPTLAVPPSTSTHKPKTLNIFTYKFHALGDYVWTIRLFGGTDSFSTQLVRFVCPGYHIH